MMLNRKIRIKGALFIEYAILLAFITISGLVLTNSSGISGSITNIFKKAANITDTAAAKKMNTEFTDFIDKIAGDGLFIKINGNLEDYSSMLQGVVYNSGAFSNLNGQYKEISMDDFSNSLDERWTKNFKEYKSYPENSVIFSDGKAAGKSDPNVYLAWTEGRPNEGETVKVMIAKVDGAKTTVSGKEVYANQDTKYYVVESTVKNGSFTKDIVDSGKIANLKPENGMSSEQALKEFYKK